MLHVSMSFKVKQLGSCTISEDVLVSQEQNGIICEEMNPTWIRSLL